MEINGVTLTEEMIQIAVVIGIIGYTFRAFYCRTLKKTLDLVAEEEDRGKKIGQIYALFVVLMYTPLVQSLGITAALYSILFFIRYWVKVDNIKVLLEEHNRLLENLKAEENENI